MATTSSHPTGTGTAVLPTPAGLLVANAAALAVVLMHVLIDFHIGLYGESAEVMTLAQAANVFRIAVTAGGWAVALGFMMRGSKTGTACALVFAAGWAFLFNGLVAFVVAPPPSAAAPYQDLTHAGGVLLGGLAAYALYRHLGRQEGNVARSWVLLTVAWLFFIAPALAIFATPVMG